MRKEKFHSQVLSRLAPLAHPYLPSFSGGGRAQPVPPPPPPVITRCVSPLQPVTVSGHIKAFTAETLLQRQRGPFPSVCLQTVRPAPAPYKSRAMNQWAFFFFYLSAQFHCCRLPTWFHTRTEFKLSSLLLQMMLFVLHLQCSSSSSRSGLLQEAQHQGAAAGSCYRESCRRRWGGVP